jgi:hypothetical protein
MARKYVAFDLEIANPIPDGGGDWQAYRPLGIACAATLSVDGQLDLWHGRSPGGEITDRMSPEELGPLVDHLQGWVAQGYIPLTWNGLGFDFDILAEESGRLADCRDLARLHVDMMFQVFCLKGYGLALDTAAKGMGLPGKPAGMSGALAPQYWMAGRRQEVLDYLEQDVRTTLALAQAVERERGLSWTARSGRPQFLPLPAGWLTVQEAMQLPLPDTSWMRRPWPRAKFTGWLE